MPDVTELIHKISYDVNDEALQNATKAIQLQIAELAKLNKALDSYTKQLAAMTSAETAQLEELARKIEYTNTRIRSTAAKTKGLLQQAFDGVIKGLTGNDGVKDGVAKYVAGVIQEFSKLQAASKQSSAGFAAHIKNVGTAGASILGTFKNLGSAVSVVSKGVFGFTNVVGIALTVLSLFSDEIFGTKEKTEDLGDAMDEAAEYGRELGDAAGGEIAKLITLKARIEDTTGSYKNRIDAIKELKEKFPGYFDQLSQEELLAGKVAEAYNKVVKSIVAKARASVLGLQLEKAVSEIEELKKKIESISEKNNIEIKTTIHEPTGLNLIDIPGVTDKKEDIVKPNIISALDNNSISFSDTNRGKVELKRNDIITELNRLVKQYNSSVDDIKDTAELIAEALKDANIDPGGGGGNLLKKREKTPGLGKLPTRPLKEIDTNIPKQSIDDLGVAKEVTPEQVDIDVEELSLKERLDPFKYLSEEQKDNIKEQISGYEDLAKAASDAYDKILQAQIDALDKEISLREKRVEEARRLAERGNVEALRIEEERLNEAQKKRERFAKRQQAVNSAITVSNAIAAVARAALEGGGFGSAATIAALIAALAAGYAAVTSMTQDTGAYADGVVDYKGKGGPRDDKNWVRISNGDSVITAEGTKKNRHLLEAINKGAVLHMSDMALPILMPSFKQPGIARSNTYASAKDMNKLERKLDEVVYAIEDNKLKQNIFFNEQGVGMMTERAISRNRKRWK